MSSESTYDVIILGAGLGGSMLGAILAKNGLRVLLTDAGTHPRFAIGEATTPDTSFRLKLLAAKYDLPEIGHLSQFYLLRDHIGPSSGVKRAFSFLYHRPDSEHLGYESHQFPTGAPPWGPDCHLFRQDTDSYMLTTASRYGAHVRQGVASEAVDIGADGAVVRLRTGETLRAAYVVDAAGYRSPLAKQFGLRGDPTALRTNSRGIFTHMTGVTPYDRLRGGRDEHGLPYPLSQTTLHHVFPGGWMWVIPFDNHVDATNHLCSVGLMLDRSYYPESGKDAKTEFSEFVQRFPRIAEHLAGARAVRNWVSTDRVQYWSHQTVGDRFCLLPHAAGFIDPLYSSGINLTVGVIDLLGAEILRAFETKDFSAQSFAYIDEFFQDNLRLYDVMVANSYLSWQNYDLWDAWYRVWVALLQVGTYINGTQLMRYHAAHDKSVLEKSRGAPYNGLLGSKWPASQALFQEAAAIMDRFRAGELGASVAANQIRDLLRNIDFCPSYWRLHDPSIRTTPAYTMPEMVRAYAWYWLRSPSAVREQIVGFDPWTAGRYALGKLWDEEQRNRRRLKLGLRDSIRTWNRDWLG